MKSDITDKDENIIIAPSNIQETGRTVAIGDVHGDVKCLKRCLSLAGLIDEAENWCGKDTVVVQVGDIFDRGDDDLEVLRMVHKLNSQAQYYGGSVTSLLGNHEVMSIVGNHKFVTPGSCIPFNLMRPKLDQLLGGDWSAFAHLPEHERCRAAAFAPGGLLSSLMASHPVVLKVGDTLFCHGGLSSSLLEDQSIEEMNLACSLWIQGLGPMPEALVGGKPGSETIVWNRAYSMPESRDIFEEENRWELDRTLSMAGASRMVVGHTPQQVGINSACEGQVWRVDTGLSAFYGGVTEVLEICGDQVSVLTESQTSVAGRFRASIGWISQTA
eukprot:CAMPEP_0117752332 /NCGR_PEP_ID=MMETSP0947-20121206/11541_1 /TAXON_ID=44440 /ORGANISM="Chattonella subsalsa, Strain CCMP2191" /LENGTH=328 /DNA_ID=CAMNT_0005570951 /DNA_START=363 /DNA_END=1349 /DNA_ORIENTATION=+